MYLSCEWIESRVVLELDKLKFCCIGHSGNKGYVPICDYHGGELSEAQIRAARAKLIRDNNTPGVETGCTGCHFLQKRDWENERKSTALFEAVYVASFSICNLSCRYCFVYLREFTEMSNVVGYPLAPVFQQLIEKGLLVPGAYIEWGGGEPTIAPGFAEVMRMLMRLNHRQQIHTSSVKFSPEVEEGLRNGSVKAVTSVDAGTRATYEEVKGRDRFEVVWESVGKYARTGGDMTLKYILRRNNSSVENVLGFMDRAEACGIKKIVLTPDFREITQGQVTTETIYAFARMVQEAERRGIASEIRDEYLNPEQMRIVTKYIPLRRKGWRYWLDRAQAAGRRALSRLAKDCRRLLETGRTKKALARAAALLEKEKNLVHPLQVVEDPQDSGTAILELLEYQTRQPSPELRATLTEIVTRALPIQAAPATILGVTKGAWTAGGKSGYVLLDATRSLEPIQLDLWFTCWAKPSELPVRLTISDGVGEDIQHTYVEAVQLRVAMPAVPAGESRIFAVKTDKTWSLPSGDDPRALGVQITTSI